MLSQQQSQQEQQHQHQQHVLQLSPYNQHTIHQPLVTTLSTSSIGVGTIGSCHNSIITTAASASSSPSCTSPIHTQQLPAISSVINGLNGSSGAGTTICHNGTTVTGGGVTVATTPYHQLAIIASPIVITSTTLENPTDMGTQAMSLQSLGGGGNSGSRVATTTLGGICPSAYKSRNATTVMHPSALAYATNAYVIGTGPGAATSCATASLGGLEQNIDGSPLLSFSEVTNTLLNQ